MRLIDLDTLLCYPFRINRFRHVNMHFAYGVESVIEYAKSLPTVEAKMTEQDIELQRLRAEIAELSDKNNALTALREQQERDKGCDFCLDPDGDNCDNGLYIDRTHKAAITTHDVYVPIEYCPMCGKKLEAEK